jgi:hypothetical protein
MSTSLGRILRVGVPFVYASNVKANLSSIRNLPFTVEALDTSVISGAACVTPPPTSPSSPIPSSHLILSC